MGSVGFEKPVYVFVRIREMLARPNPRTSARLIADLDRERIRVNFQSLHGKDLLSLPTRRLIRSTDRPRTSPEAKSGMNGVAGKLPRLPCPLGCYPAYITGLAVHDLRTHADPANRYSNRDARIAPGPLMRLPFFCFNPGPRGLAMIQNSRSLSKRSGDHTNNGRETNRHMTGSH